MCIDNISHLILLIVLVKYIQVLFILYRSDFILFRASNYKNIKVLCSTYFLQMCREKLHALVFDSEIKLITDSK